MSDPYKVLGVSRDASDEEIKKAYRALSRKYHPDANIDNPNKDQAEKMFKIVQQAYEQIMDERERGFSGTYQGNASGQSDPWGFGGFGSYGGFGGSAGRGNGSYGNGSYGGGSYGSGSYGNGSSGSGSYGGSSYGGGAYGDGSGSYGGGSATGSSRSYGPDLSEPRMRAAANYINSRHFQEAMNVLERMDGHTATWYYLHALANAGLGSNVSAAEDAGRAAQMEPDNYEFQRLHRQLSGSGDWYDMMGRGYGYGGSPCAPANRETGTSPAGCCTLLALCNCCMFPYGGFCCC